MLGGKLVPSSREARLLGNAKSEADANNPRGAKRRRVDKLRMYKEQLYICM